MPEPPNMPVPTAPAEASDGARDEDPSLADNTSPVEQRWVEPASVAEDWLDRICPYLLSEDGTYRSSEPDPDHRCTAQDPPSSLPLAFQERFCLSERHVRCEMYKVAQSARSAALGEEGIPAEQVRSARFRPSVRSVPLALGPASGATSAGSSGSRRPVILAALAVGGLAVLIFALVLFLGGGGSTPGVTSSPSPSIEATSSAEPPASPDLQRTSEPTPAAEPTPETSLAASAEATSPVPSDLPVAGSILIEYEVQEGEALVAISETFGTSRREILLANPGMQDQKPHTQPGDIIIVPVSAALAREVIRDAPGFVRFVE